MIKEEIKQAYGIYWQYVEEKVDENGWVQCKDVPHMLDYYYECNTKEEIEFEKGSSPTGYSRWRPKQLKQYTQSCL